MRKAYLLVFDKNYELYDYKEFHNQITKSPSISNWWHYIKSCYILISKLSAYNLSEEIRKMLPDHRFLLTQIRLNNSNGWLPKKAWKWIHRFYD